MKYFNMFKNPNNLIRLALIVLLGALITENVWLYYTQQKQQGEKPPTTFKEQEQRYPHLSKRILVENPNDLLINFLDLRKRLREEAKPFGQDFALYFEYLPTGTSIGINEKLEFVSGSLFKVPVAMAYLRKKERLGIKEDKTVVLGEEQMDPRFGNLWKLGPGAKINLAEAVKLSLTESDNTAVNLLLKEPEVQDYQWVYEGLDIDLKGKAGEPPIITNKSLSSILKALYFSAILNKENSELVLKYLSESKFDDQIVAGVPKDVAVAHKIGVFGEAFMDCAIVYVPKRPYLLCMRSKSDQQTAQERMKKISKIVYDYVSTEAKDNE